MAEEPYVGFIYCPPEVEQKIKTKHNLTLVEVREAALRSPETRWDDQEQYGLRLLVWGNTYGGRRIMAILKPLDETDGTWELRTAIEMNR